MRALFLLLLSALVLFCPCEAKLKLDEWLVNGVSDYKGILQKKFGTLSDKDIKQSRIRAEEAKKEKKYLLEIAEREKIASQISKKGKDSDPLQDLLALCLARANAIAQPGAEGNGQWHLRQEAIWAYSQAETEDDQAKALFFMALSSNAEEAGRYLAELSSLMSLPQLRKKFPELEHLGEFRYLTFSFDENSTVPTLCFSFSHLLQEGLKPQDYISVDPVVDGAFIHKGDRLCVRGLSHGKSYDFILKKGIKSQYGEEILENIKLDTFVPDQEPRLSFQSQAHILRKGEKNLIPLTTTNVEKAQVKVRRVPERSLAKVHHMLNSSGEWLTADSSDLVAQGSVTILEPEAVQKNLNKNIVSTLDLDVLLKEAKPGVYVIVATADGPIVSRKTSSAVQWVVITDMGLSTYLGKDGMTVDVRSLSTAAPLGDAKVSLVSRDNDILAMATCNKEGLAHFDSPLMNGKGGNSPYLVISEKQDGKEFSFLFLSDPAFDLTDRGSEGRHIPTLLEAYLYTDRGVYRAGEVVHLNALLRNLKGQAKGKLPLIFKFARPGDGVAIEETRDGDDLGHYDQTFQIPETARTGEWIVTVHTDPKGPSIGTAHFMVEDFVPTRLSVLVEGPETPLTSKDAEEITVTGKYLFGAVASHLPGKAELALSKHHNPFPDYQTFSFGLAESPSTPYRGELSFTSVDEKGRGVVHVAFPPDLKTTHPLLATIAVTLRDPAGRSQTGAFKQVALSFPTVIGIKPAFGNSLNFDAKDAAFDVIVLDTLGKSLVTEDLTYELVYEETYYNWYKEPGSSQWAYRPVIEDRSILKGKVPTTGEAPIRLLVPVEAFGNHRLVIQDPKTGTATSTRFSKGYSTDKENGTSPHRLRVVSDAPHYSRGDKVRLHVDSAFDGVGRLVIANQSVISSQTVALSRAGTDIDLLATDEWGAGVYAIITAYRPLKEGGEKTTAFMPKRAVGLTWLAINSADHQLNIALNVPEEIQPNQTLTVPLQVTGGNEGTTHVTIAAVDEGILQLTGFKTPDPFAFFFGKAALGLEIRDVYGRLIDPLEGAPVAWRSGGDAEAFLRNLSALARRKIKILSLYQGSVALDKEGRASVKLEIPEFNGRIRLMAVAFTDKAVGSGEAGVLVRRPVVVDVALPRYVSVGDEFILPILLHNVAHGEGEYILTLAAQKGLELVEDQPQHRITLKKGERQTLEIKAKATQAGEAKVVLTLNGPENLKLTSEETVPVVYPYVPDVKTQLQLLKPGEIFHLSPEAFKGLASGTGEISLTFYGDVPWDATSYLKALRSYPYTCAEQLTSRGIAEWAALKLLSSQEKGARANLERLFTYLSDLQRSDGTFSLWPRSSSAANPWLTASIVHLLQKANEEGIPFSQSLYKQAVSALNDQLRSLPSRPTDEQLLVYSYNLYLLAKEKTLQSSEIRYFYDTYYKHLPNKFAKSFLIATLTAVHDEERLQQALKDWDDKPVNGQSGDHLDAEGLLFGSDVRNAAGIVALLLEAGQNSPDNKQLSTLITQSLEVLAAKLRVRARLSTQEKAWILIATQGLMATKKEASFKVAINGEEESLKGFKTLTYRDEDVPQDMAFKNTSDQPLWMGVTTQGIPVKANPAVSEGMKIQRHLYTLKGEVAAEDKLKQGESYVVVVEGAVVGEQTEESRLLVVDYLSAGIDIENPALNPIAEGTEATLTWLKGLTPLAYREMRDDRFIAALTLAKEQTDFKVAYVIRASGRGTYHAAGTHIEDMYKPQRYVITDSRMTKIQS